MGLIVLIPGMGAISIAASLFLPRLIGRISQTFNLFASINSAFEPKPG
jgi:hypothetical protein